MAIQVRRGLKADFDPLKMLPGEWAVSIDDDTHNQIVWMCFAAGVVKRMGTYEDFVVQIEEATADIRDKFIEDFAKIRQLIEEMQTDVEKNKDIVVQIKDDFTTTYLPKIEEYVAAAAQSKENAATSEKNAKDSENAAENWSLWSKSYAVGEGGKRPGEDTDNAKYYYEQALRISQGLEGALLPMGTIEFSKLSDAIKSPGYMYNISDAFTSTEDFEDGGGKHYGAGSNVYYTVGDKWDVMAPNGVVGIKGTNEVTYRQGLVELSAANVGAVPDGGDTAENIVTFNDVDPSSETGFPAIENIASGEKHKSIFEKLHVWGRGLARLITLLGSADISKIGDGTVTSALAALMTDKLNKTDIVNDLISTAADKVLSAAMGKQLQDEYSKLNTEKVHNITISGNVETAYEQLVKDNWASIQTGFSVVRVERGSVAGAFVHKVNDKLGEYLVMQYGYSSPRYCTIYNDTFSIYALSGTKL